MDGERFVALLDLKTHAHRAVNIIGGFPKKGEQVTCKKHGKQIKVRRHVRPQSEREDLNNR